MQNNRVLLIEFYQSRSGESDDEANSIAETDITETTETTETTLVDANFELQVTTYLVRPQLHGIPLSIIMLSPRLLQRLFTYCYISLFF